MLKRIANLLVKDLVYSGRENILVYIIALTVILALGAMLFLPSLEQRDIRIAIDSSVPSEVGRQLEAYFLVEHYDDYGQLRDRVIDFDDVPGLYFSNGEYVVLLEGNEENHVRELPGKILDHIFFREELAKLSTISLGRESSPVREYTAMFFLMAMFQVGGIYIGLSIVDERQSGAIRALAVTPINTLEYMLGKSILGLLITVSLTIAVATIILGPSAIDYMQLIVWVIASLGITIFIGFLIGLVSNNMITAIALMKVVGLFVSGVPLAALLLPDRLMWLLYPFPNYWSVEGFFRMFIHTDLPLAPANLVSALYSLVLVFLLLTRFGYRLRLTTKGGV